MNAAGQDQIWICPKGHKVPGNYCTLDGSVREGVVTGDYVPMSQRRGAGRTPEHLIEIVRGEPTRPYRVIDTVAGRAGYRAGGVLALWFKGTPETAERHLREAAAKRGADARINASYERRSKGEVVVAPGAPFEVTDTAVEYTDT